MERRAGGDRRRPARRLPGRLPPGRAQWRGAGARGDRPRLGSPIHRADRAGESRDRPRGHARRRGGLLGQGRDDGAAPGPRHPLRHRAPSRRAAAGRAGAVRSADRPREPRAVPRLSVQDPGARRPPSPAGRSHAARPGPVQDHQRHPRARGGRHPAQADRTAVARSAARERPGGAPRRRRVHRGHGRLERPQRDRRLCDPHPRRRATAGPARQLRCG